VYIGELFPSHLRAKGFTLGIAGITLMNVIFLEAAPTAFANIGWKFYLLFIFLSTFSAIIILLFWPDLRHKPLEEIAAIFGDDDELYKGIEAGRPELEEKVGAIDNKAPGDISFEHTEVHPE